jgi:hypothetical protein
MTSRLALAAASAALLALAGCTAPGASEAADGPTDADAGAPTTADCLLGTWSLDVADLAEQLGTRMSDLGLTVRATQAAGEVTLDVTEGSMVYTSAATFALTTAVGDGPEMVVTQAQDGVSQGDWTADDSTLRFSSWENGLTFTTTVTIGGETTDMPLDLPAESFGGGAAQVSCGGSEMTTVPEGGLFTSTWTRVG